MQSRKSRSKLLMVVDDDPDILDFLYDLFSLEGYRVLITTKADSLIQSRPEELPDLILLDMFLSGYNGCDIARQLKNQEETRAIPIIMFSAHPNVEAIALAAGADAFQEKPFDIDVLISKIAYFF